jgi:hypothetical protein
MVCEPRRRTGVRVRPWSRAPRFRPVASRRDRAGIGVCGSRSLAFSSRQVMQPPALSRRRSSGRPHNEHEVCADLFLLPLLALRQACQPDGLLPVRRDPSIALSESERYPGGHFAAHLRPLPPSRRPQKAGIIERAPVARKKPRLKRGPRRTARHDAVTPCRGAGLAGQNLADHCAMIRQAPNGPPG